MSADPSLHEGDVRLLNELLASDHLSDSEAEAFEDMADRIAGDYGGVLTPKQRAWANSVAERCEVEPSEGPEAEKESRFTPAPVPRGREVQILVKKGPLRPPGK
jgi:hypothetical protein